MKTKIVLTSIIAFAVVCNLVLTVVLLVSFYAKPSAENDTAASVGEIGIIYRLDVAYERELAKTQSNADITALNERYAGFWEQEAEYIYKHLEEYYIAQENDECKQELSAAKLAWDEYYAKQTAYTKQMLLQRYESGSVVPIKSSNYERLLWRQRCISLYEMCVEQGLKTTPL